MNGTVSGYQVRYQTSDTATSNPFTDANFAAAGTAYDTSAWTGFAAGGATESRTLSGLPSDPNKGTFIWVAVKGVDKAGNIGPLGAGSTSETMVMDSLAAPTVTKVYPRQAPKTSPALIAIAGTNFINGALANLMTSPATPLTGVTIISPTKMLATVPANLAPGVYHITVTTGGGVSSQTTADNYQVMNGNESPSVPSQIQNFTAGDKENGQSTLTWTNPNDSDMATLEVRRYAGAYPSVYDAGGTLVYAEGPVEPNGVRTSIDTGLTNGTTYYYVAFIKDTSDNWSVVQTGKNADTATPGALPAPTISGITPSSSNEGLPVNLTISGNNFSDSTVKLTNGSNTITVPNPNVTATQITGSFTIPLAGPTGIWSVVVTNADGQTVSTNFTVNPALPAPTVTKIYPNRAPNPYATLIAIEGTNFASNATAAIQTSPTATPLTISTFVDQGKLLAIVPRDLTPGTYHITVSNGAITSNQTDADNFQVTNGNENPAVPPQVQDLRATAGDKQVKLNWTNPSDNDMSRLELRRYTGAYPSAYDAGGTLVSTEAPVESNGARTFTDTGLTNGTTYYYVAFIKDTSGNWSTVESTAPNINAVKATPSNLPAPTITSIDPNNGIQGNTVTAVNVIGTNFVTGETVKLSKAGQDDIPAAATYYSSTYLSCTIPIPSNAAVGAWDVVVTGPDTKSATLTGGFTVFAPGSNPPTITGIAPAKGQIGTTVNITNLAGTNFASGATVKLAKTGQADIAMTGAVVTPTKITGSFVIPQLTQTGSWTVMVTNSGTDKQTAQLVGGFTITSEATGNADVPLNLMSTKSGNNVILTWSAPASGEPTGGYRVFRGTSPTAITTQIGNDVAAGTHTLTDTGAVSTTNNYFYAVKSFNGTTVSAPSSVAFIYKTPLTAGANNIFWISLPYKNSYTTAQSIVNDINGNLTPPAAGTVSEIGRWNTASGTYQTYTYLEGLGWSGTNFTATTGESYYIAINSSASWMAVGANNPNFKFSLSYPNGTNIYWSSLPYGGSYANAQAIVTDLGASNSGSVVEIGRFNASGVYETYSYLEGLGWSGTNFTFTPGEGYYISVSKAVSNWQPLASY